MTGKPPHCNMEVNTETMFLLASTRTQGRDARCKGGKPKRDEVEVNEKAGFILINCLQPAGAIYPYCIIYREARYIPLISID
jgi:hypothetical protein